MNVKFKQRICKDTPANRLRVRVLIGVPCELLSYCTSTSKYKHASISHPLGTLAKVVAK